VACAIVMAALLATMAKYYHPAYGFTALIEFPAASHGGEIPAVRSAPHYDHPESGGYDGQYYAQLAVDPLLWDPAIDYTLDLPPYRAHRILFSWTAYALGLGRPAWVLEAYAVQNILCWVLLAFLLWRWMPPASAKMFALWAGALLSHGLLMSMRYALPGGPSLLLIAVAVAAAERQRPMASAVVIGIAGLGRETNLLAASMLARAVGRGSRAWWIGAVCVVLCVLPMLLWLDYLRSIYHQDALATGSNLTLPFVGVVWKAGRVLAELRHPVAGVSWQDATAFAAFLAQAFVVLRAVITGRDLSSWAVVAASFLALALVTDRAVWDGTPGAYTRVLIPLTVGADVVLARSRAPSWLLVGLVNLGVLPGVALLFQFHWT
jgi:hypothetical protein